MGMSPDALTALGRSLWQDLAPSLDAHTWVLPAGVDDELPALGAMGMDTQAIATFTADLLDLAAWLTAGLTFSGASALEKPCRGQAERSEAPGTLAPSVPQVPDSGLAEGAEIAVPSKVPDPSAIANSTDLSQASRLNEAAHRISPAHSGTGNSGTGNSSAGATEPNLRPSTVRVGLGDLAKQLESSGWPGGFPQQPQGTDGPPTHRDSPMPTSPVAHNPPWPHPCLEAEVESPWREPVTVNFLANGFLPNGKINVTRLSSVPLTANLPSAELQALATPAQPSPREVSRDQRDSSWLHTPSPDWPPAPSPELPEFTEGRIPRSRDAPSTRPLHQPVVPLPDVPQAQPSTSPLLPWANAAVDPNDPDPNAPEFGDLMDAIAQSITREYHRFYGP